MPENCMPPVNIRSSELLYFEIAAASGEYWNETRCRNCPGLRTPSIHASCCGHMSSEIMTRRSITTSQEVVAAVGIQTRSRSRDQSSRYFGVRFRPDLSKWVAEIRVAEWKPVDKKVWLGTFESEEGAARAVDAARKLLNCRKKRPANFPCENLTKYSERIPSHLILTNIEDQTMFKHVTQFVKKKSQEYAATFNLEDIQALLSELPELKIAPQDLLDQTSYSQESNEDVLADQVESQEDVKPCVMRTVSDESDYETTHSRRHSHSHSVSSVAQSWLAEDAGEVQCSLEIHQDMPIVKRLKREPMVMDDVEMFHSRESTERLKREPMVMDDLEMFHSQEFTEFTEFTEFHLCNSMSDPLHLNFSGMDHQCSDAERVDFGEQGDSIVDPNFYISNFECGSERECCTTLQAHQPMAMNVELPFPMIYDNQIMGAEMSATWSSTVQPLMSSYIERESFDNVLRSGVLLDPTSPTEVMKDLSSPLPAHTNMDAADYLASLLQDDGTANYGFSCLDDYSINLGNECSPSPDNESVMNVRLLDPYFCT